jgi:tyrosine-protein kinase Etk/Wzc
MGEQPPILSLDWLQLPSTQPALTLTVEKNGNFLVEGEGISMRGIPGKLAQGSGVAIRVRELRAPEGTRFKISQQTHLGAINALLKRFSVTEKGKESGVLELSLTGHDRDKIATTLNHIANSYLQQNIARQAAQDSQSLAFLKQQLPKVRGELDVAEGRLNNYRKKRDSVDLSLEAKSVLEQIVNVDNQLNELTFREAEVSQHFKKDHPTYRALREKRGTLEKERERLNKRVGTMPSTQQEILRLSRDVDSGRAVYLQLLTRQQELDISRSSTIGNVRIIDSAVAQPDPIQPRKGLIVVLATLLGVLLSSGLVLAYSAFRQISDCRNQSRLCGGG